MEPMKWKCHHCGYVITNGALHCPKCGEGDRPIYAENYCINNECHMYAISLSDPEQRYCKVCGGPTRYHQRIEDLC